MQCDVEVTAQTPRTLACRTKAGAWDTTHSAHGRPADHPGPGPASSTCSRFMTRDHQCPGTFVQILMGSEEDGPELSGCSRKGSPLSHLSLLGPHPAPPAHSQPRDSGEEGSPRTLYPRSCPLSPQVVTRPWTVILMAPFLTHRPPRPDSGSPSLVSPHQHSVHDLNDLPILTLLLSLLCLKPALS